MPSPVPTLLCSPSPGAARLRRGTGRRRGPALALRVGACACLLLALVLSAATGWGDVPPWACPALALVLLAARLASPSAGLRAARWPFSLSEGVVAAALVVSPGAWVVAAAGGDALLLALRRPGPRVKRDVDVARTLLAVAAASAVTAALEGGVLAAAAGVVVLGVVGHALTAVAVHVTTSRPLRSLLACSARAAAAHTAGSAAVGLLAGHLFVAAPVGLLGLAVPLLLLRSSYDRSTRRSAEARLLAELAAVQGRTLSRSHDASWERLVTTTARLLGGADVELVVLAADGPVRFLGDESGAPERRRVRADVFDEPWVLRALGAAATTAGHDGARPCLSAVLGEPERPVGVLQARRGPHAPAFERRELRLVDLLLSQSGAWSQTPAAGPAVVRGLPVEQAGDGAAALHLLAASGERLAQLAAAAPADLDELVQEVHLAQRAVACVLGARALDHAPAPSPSLWRTDSGAPRRRSAGEWTTTGVLP